MELLHSSSVNDNVYPGKGKAVVEQKIYKRVINLLSPWIYRVFFKIKNKENQINSIIYFSWIVFEKCKMKKFFIFVQLSLL